MTAVLSENSLRILKKRYLEPNESVDHMFHRVAGGNDEFEKIMADLDFLPNSPTLMNAGTVHEGKSTFSACFTADTVLHTLGGDFTVAQLLTAGKTAFKIFSTDGTRLKVGDAFDLRKTRSNAPVFMVTFDVGGGIKLTADHLVMMRDGTYRRVDALRPGDSLMPFNYDRLGGYRIVWQLIDTHPIAAYKWSFLHANGRWAKKGMHIHHKDFDKTNDDPTNLQELTQEEHAAIHFLGENNPMFRPDVAAKISQLMQGNKRGIGPKPGTAVAMRGKKHALGHRHSSTFKAAQSNRMRGNVLRRGYVYSAEERAKIAELKRSRKLAKAPTNHKVVSVEQVGFEDVYDLSVHTYHNFAANGIFIHNCFKFDVADTMLDGEDSIVETLRKATGVAKWGGGVGYYFGNLRAKNKPIRSVHRVACGPINVLKTYNLIGMNLITQGGRRELAQMGILPVDHDDIREFIHVKDADPQALRTFNISVAAHDQFMRQVFMDGHVKSMELWNEIVDSAWKTGDPGLYFNDTAERFNPTPHLGKLTGTNPCGEVPLLNNEPCLTGDSLVDTPSGLIPIATLATSTDAFVVNTYEQIAVPGCRAIVKGVKPTIKLWLSTGQVLRCTPNHRILTDKGWVEACNLVVGSNVRIADKQTCVPCIADHPVDEMLGWFLGDGWLTKVNSCGILFSQDDQEAMDRLMPVFDAFVGRDYALQTQPTGVRQKSCERFDGVARFTDLGFTIGNALTKELPTYILTSSSDRQLAFLRGLFSADGGVKLAGCGLHNLVCLSSSSRKLLEQVQILLLRYGIQSRIQWTHFKTEDRNDQGQLQISGESALRYMAIIGFNLSAKSGAFEPGERYNRNKEYIPVVHLERGADEPVYDIVMPSRHHFIANGIVVHNCNLGSINLGNFVTINRTIDWSRLEDVVRTATRFLDNILDRNTFPHPAITKIAYLTRKLGLGVMGWAGMLALMHIHYDTDEAVQLADAVSNFINEVSADESLKLGKEKGPYPGCKDDEEYRNATRTCIAPTGTIAILADAMGASIEPFFALEWDRTLNKGVEGKEETIHEYIPRWEELEGFVPKTTNEIHYSWHVKHQAAWQKNVNLAVSKTINLPNSATRQDISDAYKLMWELGCKGGTIFRDGCRAGGEQVLTAKPAVSTNGNGNSNGHALEKREEVLKAFDDRPLLAVESIGTSIGNIKGLERIEFPNDPIDYRPKKLRPAIINTMRIGDFEGYLHAGMREDGSLCEIFITSSKEGSTVAGLLDSWAIAVSFYLQQGGSLERLVRKYSGMRFEPNGRTNDDNIPICTSIQDYIVRWLDLKFGSGRHDENHKGMEVHSGMLCPECSGPAVYQGGCLTCKNRCGWSRCG